MSYVNASRIDRPIDSFDVSDRWLRVFVAVARGRSFTSAAAALRVGQPSVSHAIRQLERAMDTTLFDRATSPVSLTASGELLLREIGPAFDAVDRGLTAVRSQGRAIATSVSTSFATWWLLPRLNEFKSTHPDLELRCITTDTDDRVGHDDADLWIPQGAGPWPGLEAETLTAERIVAVAAPALADALDDSSSPTSIANAPLLHLEERYQPRFDWSTWCAMKGVDPPMKSGMVSNDYAVVVQAALDGQGVAIGWEHIVGPLLDARRLVQVGGASIQTDSPFVILRRPQRRSDALDRLCRWLIDATA